MGQGQLFLPSKSFLPVKLSFCLCVESRRKSVRGGQQGTRNKQHEAPLFGFSRLCTSDPKSHDIGNDQERDNWRVISPDYPGCSHACLLNQEPGKGNTRPLAACSPPPVQCTKLFIEQRTNERTNEQRIEPPEVVSHFAVSV